MRMSDLTALAAGMIFAAATALSPALSAEKKSGAPAGTPPGQEKKLEGEKSAKEFAPGQQKKLEGEKSAKEFAPGQEKKQ